MKKEPAPRYIVRLPDGEVEMDAREIFELFQRHKADFQTLIRPVEGGDWRKIGLLILNVLRPVLAEWDFHAVRALCGIRFSESLFFVKRVVRCYITAHGNGTS